MRFELPPDLVFTLMVICTIGAHRVGRGTALVALAIFAPVPVSLWGATTELPGIVVTGATPARPPDIVSRDRAERSPDIHWPAALSLKWSEMFSHNTIEINASCATVWTHLIEAQLWSQWNPDCGTVKIKDGSQVLQMGTRFSWAGLDLPVDSRVFGEYVNQPVSSRVSEYVPERRIGWLSFGVRTAHGPLCEAYHAWLLTPIDPRRCRVTFEEVATGSAARYARGTNPEISHISHERWLEGLKRVSER